MVRRSKFAKRLTAALVSALLVVTAFCSPVSAVTLNKQDFTFYMVPNSHLDTSWQWPFQYTAENLLRTMYYNFTRSLDGNENYLFSTSASKHYEWARDYYNSDFYDTGDTSNTAHKQQIWSRIKTLVANGQLDITGGQVTEPDTNSPSGEAQVRSFLLGQHFFEEEFGADKVPIMGFLPDCFGFTGQYPQILLKSGLKYFVTSKLNWNDTNRNRDSDLFYWRALDGKSSVLSYVLSRDYPTTDWSASSIQTAFDRNWQQGKETGVKKALGFFGSGDSGGGLPYSANPSGGNSYAAPATLNNSSAATVKMATCTSYFEDVSADIAKDPSAYNIRTQDGEMYLEYHRGTYTSWSRMKRYNRDTEIMAEVAEKAATLAFYTGSSTSNSDDLVSFAWDKVTVNQMHDVLPGSACPYQYYVAFNNHELAQNLLRTVRDNSLINLAYRTDTNVSGKPVFVYNPLSWARDGEVTVTLEYDVLPEGVRIFDGLTQLYPSKVVRDESGKALTVTFLAANVPAIGYKVFDVVAGSLQTRETGLSVDAANYVFENEFLKMSINPETGYIKSLINKRNGRESFVQGVGTEGAELHVYFDNGGSSWPAWDLVADQMNKEPDVILSDTPVSLEIVENTPEKVTVKVVKTWDASTVTQYYSMYAGVDKIDVRLTADWFEKNRLLKVSFPILADNDMATYETAYGALQRPTTRDDSYSRARFEVPGHKYLDITDKSGAYGVSIMNNAKYGFDSLKKTISGQTFVRSRITVVRTPVSGPLSASAYGPSPNTIDNGPQDFMYAIYPHEGSWEDARTVNKAYELNYPLQAFEAAKGGTAELGASKSFAGSDKPNVIISALKNQYDTPEDRDTVIVRVYESSGRDTNGVTLTLPGNVLSVKEVNMLEHDYSYENPSIGLTLGHKPISAEGDKITFDIGKYEILTIEAKLSPSPIAADAPVIEQESVALPFDTRGVTPNSDRRAGFFEGAGTTASPGYSMPNDCWPSEIDFQGIKFDMGPVDGNGFVTASGQTIPIHTDNKYSKIFIVGAAAGTGPVPGDFSVNYDDVGLFDSNNKALTLSEAAGKTVDARVSYVVNVKGAVNANILLPIYDESGRLLSCKAVPFAIEADGRIDAVITGLDIPAEAARMETFVWDAVTFAPLSKPLASAEPTTKTIRFDGWRSDLSGWDRNAWFDTKPYIYDTVAHVNNHYHRSTGTSNSTEAMTVDNFLFAYSIDVDPGKIVSGLTLPNLPDIKIAAVTLADSPVVGFGKVYDSSKEPELTAPQTPQNVKASPVYNAVAQGADIRVTWDHDSDVIKYMVYGAKTPNFTPAASNLLSNQGSVPSFLHTPLGSTEANYGTNIWYYKIVALGRNGILSEASAASNPAEAMYIDYCLNIAQSRVAQGGQTGSSEAGWKATNGAWASNSDKWCMTGITGRNGWLRVDLTGEAGKTKMIQRFMIYHGGMFETTSYNTRNFDIEYSSDSTNGTDGTWLTAVSVTGNTDTITIHDLATPVEARYVRLVVLAGEQGSSNTSRIYEFCAMGRPDYQAISTALNPALAYSETEDGNARFTASYDYVNADGKTEGDTQFKWYKKIGDAYLLIAGANGRTLVQTKADVIAAESYRCDITVFDSDGAQGRTVSAAINDYTNLMLGAAVLSQTTPNGTARNMVDGSLDTKWDAPTNSTYSGYQGPLPHEAVFDMGADKAVRQFKVFHANSNPNAQDYDKNASIPTYDFDLSYSTDNVNWVKKEIRANTEAVTTIDLGASTPVRYVKISVITPNAGFLNGFDDNYRSVRILQIEANKCIVD
ncbi:MAG: discoidin domain-containing protein [Clostridiales Family XIII bacterium]|jgi:alpha-mannosidase|nr:discoidin domain-containing protein [Clostridiales Family XIII bacterium]